MSAVRILRLVLPACALSLAVTAAPALAFEPSQLVVEGDPQIEVTDLAGRGADIATSVAQVGDGQHVALQWTIDEGDTWANVNETGRPVRESQVTICAGHAVMVFTASYSPGDWVVETNAAPLDGGSGSGLGWTGTVVARKPDIACAANAEVVLAWLQKTGSGYSVKVKTGEPETGGSSQSFDLGSGTLGKGLAIASSSNRVYVAWFKGNKLQVRRFSIGTTSSHTLTSLGTDTVATLPDGLYPEMGADGDRVILAYMDRADLKVRRSTDKGASFGSAKTLRDEAFPGEIGAYPTTVAVKGSKVAIGAVEISEGGGKGLGYKSTNGGSSYTKVSTRSSGRIVAGLIKIGSSHRYAEAWDQSISQPDPQSVRFRRQ